MDNFGPHVVVDELATKGALRLDDLVTRFYGTVPDILGNLHQLQESGEIELLGDDDSIIGKLKSAVEAAPAQSEVLSTEDFLNILRDEGKVTKVMISPRAYDRWARR